MESKLEGRVSLYGGGPFRFVQTTTRRIIVELWVAFYWYSTVWWPHKFVGTIATSTRTLNQEDWDMVVGNIMLVVVLHAWYRRDRDVFLLIAVFPLATGLIGLIIQQIPVVDEIVVAPILAFAIPLYMMRGVFHRSIAALWHIGVRGIVLLCLNDLITAFLYRIFFHVFSSFFDTHAAFCARLVITSYRKTLGSQENATNS